MSEGLYSKDIHFILELIQNAEDNHYPNDSKPDLTFTLYSDDPTDSPNTDGCLCVFNNETGFQRDNIEKICAVGQSTKTKRDGYIGEKGIGFKSVFLVSERPHIFSNGYCFRFQEKDPEIGLGYIVPYWVDQIPRVVAESRKETSILLPLKPGKKHEITEELRKIAPETILFLRRLEGLKVRIEETDETLEIVRDERHSPFVDLLLGEHLRKYGVFKHRFECPPEIHEEKRQGINDREVTIAFPLSDPDETSGRIFAFLPTEVYSGLPFLVNADFILSSSRETIGINRKWNLWLRDCMSVAFIKAFGEILRHTEFQTQAYRFIPLVEDLKQEEAFFKTAVEKIISELSNMEVVLTTTSGRFEKPERVRLASREIRDLLEQAGSSSPAKEVFLVHKDLQKFSHRLKAIGVQELSVKELLRLIDDPEWMKERDIDWFFRLYLYLATRQIKFGTLQNIALIPTECGRLVAPKDGSIFLLPKDEKEVQELTSRRIENRDCSKDMEFLLSIAGVVK